MRDYFIRLGVLCGSMLMAVVGNIIALVAAILGSKCKPWKVAISNDQTLNAALHGDEDETISSRAGKAAREGKRWACALCAALDLIDPGHCERSIEADRGRKVG
jgi:hypothetical protein